jgi:hypothetical protein
MKMKITKGKAFLICFIAIMIIFLCLFVLVVVKDKDLSLIPTAACLTAIVTVTTTFMGIQMADNGVKGKNFSQELFNSENILAGKTVSDNVKK